MVTQVMHYYHYVNSYTVMLPYSSLTKHKIPAKNLSGSGMQALLQDRKCAVATLENRSHNESCITIYSKTYGKKGNPNKIKV